MFNLQANNVYIWHIESHDNKQQLEQYSSILSANERLRAEKIKIETQRHIYIYSHAAMRNILSDVLDCKSNDIHFETDSNGKPYLKNEQDIQFNLSHSGKHALFAICLNTPIGIDLEKMNSKHDVLAITKRFFHSNEYKWLAELNDTEIQEYFYRMWCYKEAYLKGLGTGLQGDLTKLSLSKDMLEQDSLIFHQQKPWTIQSLNITSGFKAAIAYQACDYTINYADWEHANSQPNN